jgi:hypothetical protein
MSESSIAQADQAVFAALAQSRVASGSASGHELIDRLAFLKSVVRQAEHDLLYTVVVRAIRAAMIPAKSADPGGLGRDTSLGQRQAEALGAICEHALDDGYLPAEGGERPHMTAQAPRSPSVDIELVALGILHAHRVVVEDAVLHQGANGGGAQVNQPASFGVDPPFAGLDRVGPRSAGVDVEVQPVLDDLGLLDCVEPDARPVAVGVTDPVCAVGKLLLGYPELAVEVVPGGEARWWRRQLVPQRGGPEAGEPVGIRAVDDELESDSHGASIHCLRRSLPGPSDSSHSSVNRDRIKIRRRLR